MYKTTKDDFSYFEERVRYWYNKLKISGWHIHFWHTNLNNMLAQIAIDDSGRVVTFKLCTKWDETIQKCTHIFLDGVAKHEIMHLLIRPLYAIGYSRFGSENELDKIEEELVVTLEDLIPLGDKLEAVD